MKRILQLKIYRHTFLLYAVIVLSFIFFSAAFSVRQSRQSAENRFLQESGTSFQLCEQRLEEISDSIDVFFTRLYASPGRLADFMNFFGATPEEYQQKRLDSDVILDESYLDSCIPLVQSSQYAIRHIIYYSRSNLVDMEYNVAGYSRCRTITPEDAAAICSSGVVLNTDIHQSASYAGKVSFVLDLQQAFSDLVDDNRDIAIRIYNGATVCDMNSADDVDYDSLLTSSAAQGVTTARNGQALYYRIESSERFSYTAVYTSPVSVYRTSPFQGPAALALALVPVFILITILLVHRFSRDAAYIQTILQSMRDASEDIYTPIDTTGRNDEFSMIASNLNHLYSHLDNLIQQEYKLTIQQQQVQMEMLSSQLNPHFLYNTLERIRMRAVLDGAVDVAEATSALGRMYRSIVKTEPVITISQELDITREYLELMTFLYGENFLYHYDVDAALLTRRTPKIWMQPIVENFFKHNFENDDRLKVIVLSGKVIPGGIEFCFFDNLGTVPEEQLNIINQKIVDSTDNSRIGLHNVYHRLQLFYGNHVRITMENNTPSGVRTRITIVDREDC